MSLSLLSLRSALRASLLALAPVLASSGARAEAPVQRTVSWLPASNGHGALLLDLKAARLNHFREHIFAFEEPALDGAYNEVWAGNQPQSVKSRDLLYDAYFGLRGGGKQRWLTDLPVDLDRSGYLGFKPGVAGGTGVASMAQADGDLELTTVAFMPRSLGQNGFVLALQAKNKGAQKLTGLKAFSLHNFHLGFGRPGVMSDIGEQGETVGYSAAKGDFVEKAFAGVVVGRALGPIERHAAWAAGASPDKNGYELVAKGGELFDVDGDQPTADGSVSAFQLTLPDLDPGASAWVGVAFAHHPDPFAASTVQGWLDGYVGAKGAGQLVDDELASWASLQAKLAVPAGLSPEEEALFRQSAVMLSMGQSHEGEYYLREFLSADGEPRYTRSKAKLPASVKHKGKGAVLASLPPGEWTVSWARDSAYAVVALASAGLKDEAREALSYYLSAEGGLFQGWNELKPYSMPPYQISLVRYHGFGIEETDFNDYGPNLEFDGFGLMLWALRQYEQRSSDPTLVDSFWPVISQKIGDALVGLIDPDNGLIRKDSSIWETHWNGRERYWTYTSLTAARGLCDAAALAERVGDGARAALFKEKAQALRLAIAQKLTDKQRALASNLEELESGEGYFDAAVVDAIAMGLFDPKGTLAQATLAGLDAHLSVAAGAGWSRNDDRFDHQGSKDWSDWGSPYDSAEWVITNMRGAVAAQLGGDKARADKLIAWTTAQSTKNYLEVAETYDESSGAYKFNSPMLGFGAGAYILALEARTAPPDPACGAYLDESVLPPPGQGTGGSGGSGGSGGPAGSGGSTAGASGGPAAGSGGASGSAAGGSPAGSAGSGASGGSSAGGSPSAGTAGVSASGGQGGSPFAGSGQGAGPSGAGQGGAGQGGSGAGVAAEPAVEESSCGCRAVGSPPSSASAAALLAWALLARRGRRAR